MLTSVQLHFRIEHGGRMVFVWAKSHSLSQSIWNMLQVAKAYEHYIFYSIFYILSIHSCADYNFF